MPLTTLVSPYMSPVVKYTITKVKGTFDRFVLSFNGRQQTVFGELVSDHGSYLDVRVFNSNAGLVQIGRQFIVGIEQGYHIWIETTDHTNTNVANSYKSDHISTNKAHHTRVRYGAYHSKKGGLKIVNDPTNISSGAEFTKITQRIEKDIMIGA